MKRRILCCLILLTMVFALCIPEAFASLSVSKTSPNLLVINENANSYGTWASPVYSYLVDTGTGYMRFECARGNINETTKDYEFGEKLFAEFYNYSFDFISSKTIPAQLEKFAGFFAGKDAYYIAFSQDNFDEDDSKEVLRVIKYDKDWNEVGHTSVLGANTVSITYGGSLRMTDRNGVLYIKTCHQMYQSEDGLRHQANMYIMIDESSMALLDANYSVSYIGTGYCSHSFNQFITTDEEGNIVSVDHGDAYPRAVVLFKKQANKSTADSWDALNIAGSIGENETGVNVGGLEAASGNYIVVGNTVKQNDTFYDNKTRNVFLGIVSPEANKTKLTYLTSYKEGKKSVGNPQLVKVSDDKLLVMWESIKKDDFEFPNITDVSYVFIDSDGNKLSEINKVNARLSDCQPITRNGKVYWYVVTEKNELRFYSLDQNGKLVSRVRGRETPKIGNCTLNIHKDGSNMVFLSWLSCGYAKGYYLYRAESKNGKYKKIATIKGTYNSYYSDYKVSKNKTYYYKVKAYKKDYTSPYSKPMKAQKYVHG